jgi:ferredoxin
MRLVVELNRCQGYAQCVFLAPEVFELRGNEALHYDPNPDDAQRLRVLRAAAACPVQAILVEQLDEAVMRIKDMTRGQGAQLVLDIVGVNSTLRMAAQVARMRDDVRRGRWGCRRCVLERQSTRRTADEGRHFLCPQKKKTSRSR